MKKVKLIKDHNGKKAGTTGYLKAGRADYLIRVGVAEEVIEAPKEVKKVAAKKATSKKASKDEDCKTC